MSQNSNQSRHEEIAERLSSAEADIRHIDERITSLGRSMAEGFDSLRDAVSAAAQKQPLTAFAGWGAIVLTLVFAFGSPLKSADMRQRERIDVLNRDQLLNAETRGRYDQRFETLAEKIDSAVINRKDMHEQVLSKIEQIEKEMDVMRSSAQHEINNGMGQRIEEKTAGMAADIEWLKQQRGFHNGFHNGESNTD